MNIFVLDKNQEKAAKYHCDKHIIKMILESAQMLSTACRLTNINEGYKATHINHPCNIWVRESISNWTWLKILAYYLNEEYKRRFNHTKDHKSWSVILNLPIPNLPMKGLTSSAQAMPAEFKDESAIIAYRNYYKSKKILFEQKNMWKYTKSKESKWM